METNVYRGLDEPDKNHRHPHSQTLYVPTTSPPTPAPSPGPEEQQHQPLAVTLRQSGSDLPNSPSRIHEIQSFLSACTPGEILYISQSIVPLLKRDFLRHLPVELGLHVLTFIDDPQTLARAACVSRWWNGLVMGSVNDSGWKRMCTIWDFYPTTRPTSFIDSADLRRREGGKTRTDVSTQPDRDDPLPSMEQYANLPMDPALEWITAKKRKDMLKGKSKATEGSDLITETLQPFSYREHFIYHYALMSNWRSGGRLLRTHRTPASSIHNSPDNVITSLALNDDWVIVGLANSRIHVFSGKTGVLARTLVGHESGVWAVCLVSPGGREVQGDASASRTPSPDHGDYSDRTSPPPKTSHSWDDLPTAETPSRGQGEWTTKTRRGRKQKMFIAPFDEQEGSGHQGEHYVPRPMRVALGLESDDHAQDGGYDSDFEGEAPWGEENVYPEMGKPSEPSGCSEGWGQPNAIIVSGGCDKTLRVWDVVSGYCIYILRGHTSTIRCIKVLHNRPIAVSGSRDSTLRVWDIRRGILLRVLTGHSSSVRCLDVCGNKVVSGSYDSTLRLWNVDTGECLHMFSGHFSQVYSIAFDGVRIISGGLDTTVRVWCPFTGECLALLQGHAALVCQVQLAPNSHLSSSAILVTGGSDGRVITYTLPHPSLSTAAEPVPATDSDALSLNSSTRMGRMRIDIPLQSPDFQNEYRIQHRLMAHDSSVTALQFDNRWLVTGGNDGRVKLWDVHSGEFVRELGGAANPQTTDTSYPLRRRKVLSTGRIHPSSSMLEEDDGTGNVSNVSPSVAECVWKAGFSTGGRVFVTMMKNGGKSVMEIWNMRPEV